MEASPAKVIEFFSGFKQSVIPLFQRPYEWKTPQWENLWADIMDQYEVAQDGGREANHFMGAIVTTPAKSVPVGVSKYLVIDGQQRLTTIAILMCAIRDELPEDAKQRSRIEKHYLTNDGYEGWEVYRLLPTQTDRDAFKALVSGPISLDDSNVQAAYRYYRSKLRSADSAEQPIDPRLVLEVIERRLMVVSINLGEADDPYLIFESLNFKGSPLTQADLVRNYYLMRFEVNDQQHIYDHLWLPMQNRLRDDLNDFMWRYMMMVTGEATRRGEIYAELKKRLQNQKPDEVKASLTEMARYAEYYQTFVTPTAELHLGAARQLERLRRWEVEIARPLLLALAHRRREGGIDDDGYVTALQAIESYVVRRAVCEIPTNTLQKVFIDMAPRLAAGESAEWLVEWLAGLSGPRRWPTDEEFCAKWITYPIYGYRSDRCKLVLESLEDACGHREPASYLPATIEHIMPQTLTDEWREVLGDTADAVAATHMNTIGNLSLTAYNPELSNANFLRKRAIYANSHYELTRKLTTAKKWDAASIEARAKDLWQLATAIWWRSS